MGSRKMAAAWHSTLLLLLGACLTTVEAFVVEGGGLCSHVRPFAGQRPDYLCRKMILRGGAGVGVGALRMVAGSPNTISALPGTSEKEDQTPINPLGASSRVLVVGASR